VRFRRWTLALTLAVAAPAAAQQPTFAEIVGHLQRGAEALGSGDTAGYLTGSRASYRLAPTSPVVAYHYARALALTGSADSALALLQRLAAEGALSAFDAPADSAFAGLTGRPAFKGIAERIARARRPVSRSRTAFELAERDLIPEGTAYDPGTRTLYLSSFYKRKIVAVSENGSVRDFTAPGQDGLGPVAGLEVDPRRGEIWAATMHLPGGPVAVLDSSMTGVGALHRYELATGRLRRRYTLSPSGETRHGFNDLTVLPNGDVYVTDSESGGVYVLRAGSEDLVELVRPGTYVFPNGITRSDDGRALFVAHGSGIDRVDPRTGRRQAIAVPDTVNLSWVDGLAFYRNSLIAHQPSSFGRVLRVRLDPAWTRVTGVEILERHHPRFAQPTTGELAGDRYYYIANAQLRRFRDGQIFPWDELDPVLILSVDLR
jgi:streptogramin lyase